MEQGKSGSSDSSKNSFFNIFNVPHGHHHPFPKLTRRRLHRRAPSTGTSPHGLFASSDEEMSPPPLFLDLRGQPPPVRAVDDDDEDVCNNMGDLSVCDPLSPSPDINTQSGDMSSLSSYPSAGTETPLMPCLPAPVPIVAQPHRCSVSFKNCGTLFGLHDDTDGVESPCKFPRHNCSLGISSRLYTRSASLLPVPGRLVVPPVAVKPQRTIMVDGLTIPVLHGTWVHDRISVETAAAFLSGRIKLPPGAELLVWDGRFFFEYDGGHIRGARRFEVPGIRTQMEELVRMARASNKKFYVLCYCQFSSARAPKLLDILRAVEKDVFLLERKGTELDTEEKSRFRTFIVDGGYDAFYSNYPDFCEPRGYVRELDDDVNGPRCRSTYEEDVRDACVSRVLMPSPATLIKRSKSSMDFRHRSRMYSISENMDSNVNNAGRGSVYCGVSDDEDSIDSRPRGPAVGKIRTLSFEEDP